MKPSASTCAFLIVIFVFVSGKVGAAEIDSGKQFYLRYCSSCHGQEGHGNGPVSRYLTVKVPDLTLIKRKNNGIYPLDKVMAAIDGRRDVRAHGDRQMPVWGEIFRVEKEKYPERTGLLKATIIADYVATLQK
jgi:hypothetical protein